MTRCCQTRLRARFPVYWKNAGALKELSARCQRGVSVSEDIKCAGQRLPRACNHRIRAVYLGREALLIARARPCVCVYVYVHVCLSAPVRVVVCVCVSVCVCDVCAWMCMVEFVTMRVGYMHMWMCMRECIVCVCVCVEKCRCMEKCMKV